MIKGNGMVCGEGGDGGGGGGIAAIRLEAAVEQPHSLVSDRSGYFRFLVHRLTSIH